MLQFCEHVVKEFRFLHQRLEHKIYLELGYFDKLPKLNDHFAAEAHLNDLISESPLSSMSWANKGQRPRPNSIAMFKPEVDERKLPRIVWAPRPRPMTP